MKDLGRYLKCNDIVERCTTKLSVVVPRILQQAKLEMVSNSRLKKAVKDLNLDGNGLFDISMLL